MTVNYIAFGIPLIFLLIGIEFFFSKKLKKNYFSFTSSVGNIAIGVAERLCQLFLTGYFILVFNYLHDHFAIFEISSSWPWWVVAFLFTDFTWYWYHRFSHEINLLWGAHVVHHSSEEYNYTVSLRITIFQAFIRLVFGMALPVIGFPVPVLLVCISILGIYQFFIHTRFVRRLGLLEKIFVTPSNHRVHHGSNPLYIDKNYGGVFIIWDRIFGTYQEETEVVKFGLTTQVNSNSFLWLHFHFWLELFEHTKKEKRFWNKLKVIFGSPDSLKYSYDAKLRRIYLSKSNLSSASVSKKNYPNLYYYVNVQVVLSLLLLFLMYLIDLSASTNFFISAIIITTVINCGAILERKKWVFVTEIIRFAFLYILLVVWSSQIFLYAYLPPVILVIIEEYRWFNYNYTKRLFKRKSGLVLKGSA